MVFSTWMLPEELCAILFSCWRKFRQRTGNDLQGTPSVSLVSLPQASSASTPSSADIYQASDTLSRGMDPGRQKRKRFIFT